MSTLGAVVTSKGAAAQSGRVNVLAIVVGVVGAFVFASVYYSLFADMWLELRRLNPTSGAEVSPSLAQPLAEIAKCALMAYVFARLVGRLQILTWQGAIRLGATLWIAFPVTLWLGAITWENTPWQLAALHSGDWLFKCLWFSVLPAVIRRG